MRVDPLVGAQQRKLHVWRPAGVSVGVNECGNAGDDVG